MSPTWDKQKREECQEICWRIIHLIGSTKTQTWKRTSNKGANRWNTSKSVSERRRFEEETRFWRAFRTRTCKKKKVNAKRKLETKKEYLLPFVNFLLLLLIFFLHNFLYSRPPTSIFIPTTHALLYIPTWLCDFRSSGRNWSRLQSRVQIVRQRQEKEFEICQIGYFRLHASTDGSIQISYNKSGWMRSKHIYIHKDRNKNKNKHTNKQ